MHIYGVQYISVLVPSRLTMAGPSPRAASVDMDYTFAILSNALPVKKSSE